MEQDSRPFGLSEIEIRELLDRCLKPEEISGEAAIQHDRVRELIKWFLRFSKGEANPKWFQPHAYELVYYIATNSGNRFVDLEPIRLASFLEGVNITPAERNLLAKFIPSLPSPPINK